MDEWTSSHDFATRKANLTDTGTGLLSRLNGDYFLQDSGTGQTGFNDSSTDTLTGGAGSGGRYALNATTVSDDSSVDTLTGGSGTDWFLFNRDNDGFKDRVTDLSTFEALFAL